METLIALTRQDHALVVVIKMPVPARFYSQLSDEAAFNDAISQLLSAENVPFHEFSEEMDEPRFYFDTDHLNRAGLTAFFSRYLTAVLVED